MSAAFYCVADSRYFLGAVGLVNSLRLQGHDQPVCLLDCGLTAGQRRLLGAEVELLPAPPDRPPHLLKAVAPLARPAEVMVLIDADMIVTRPLTRLIETAAKAGVVAFRDRQQRFFEQWGELLDLGEAQPGPYVSSGFVALGGSGGREVLEVMARCQERVDFGRTFWRGNDRDYPFLYADQDVLNAVLRTREGVSRLVALDERLAATPPFRRLRVSDERAMRCAYEDGTEPYLLHQFVRKPWLERMYHSAYSRLLARALLGDDVAIRVPAELVPLRMRDGARARAERALANAADLARFHLGDRLPRALAERFEARRRLRGS